MRIVKKLKNFRPKIVKLYNKSKFDFFPYFRIVEFSFQLYVTKLFSEDNLPYKSIERFGISLMHIAHLNLNKKHPRA